MKIVTSAKHKQKCETLFDPPEEGQSTVSPSLVMSIVIKCCFNQFGDTVLDI